MGRIRSVAKKLQIPSSKNGAARSLLDLLLGACLGFGTWDLGFSKAIKYLASRLCGGFLFPFTARSFGRRCFAFGLPAFQVSFATFAFGTNAKLLAHELL
jgi:hypothetical protein